MSIIYKNLAFLVVTSLVLYGCNSNEDTPEKNKIDESEENVIVEEEIKEDLVVYEFELNGPDERMEEADGWGNGDVFDATWRKDNIVFEDGVMKMSIDIDNEAGEDDPNYSGAEYRTSDFYHYGLYEVSMKPIENDGVVSSFFTYTGPSDDNPWDEIDIEFLGKDPTSIQFNYYTNGIGEHEYVYELGFDASEEFHTYAFEWLPDSIIWYVDGEEVYKATEDVPVTKSKLMMNVWPGIGVDEWLAPYDGTVPLTAEYEWFKITEYENVE